MPKQPEFVTTEAIKDFLTERSKVGFEKYRKTMDREDLDLEEWLTHQIEELADAIQYAWRARDLVRRDKKLRAVSDPEV